MDIPAIVERYGVTLAVLLVFLLRVLPRWEKDREVLIGSNAKLVGAIVDLLAATETLAERERRRTKAVEAAKEVVE
jgi:hypothetical protein